jgi:uncharacterized protein YbbC (DUF1343 family)
MGLAMQAAARAGIPFVVLDRPNPLGGDRSDGMLLRPGSESFVGLYPVPAVHGLTAGELALAIRGEGWLDELDDLELEVVPVQGWDRADRATTAGAAWVAPSPGLPTVDTALVYPATVLFEATTVSFGQGTAHPFSQIGAPWLDPEQLIATVGPVPGLSLEATTFTPQPTASAPEPRHGGSTVPGVRLRVTDPMALRPWATGVRLLSAVLAQADGRTVIDRGPFFDLLAGGRELRAALLDGVPGDDIINSWEGDLARWETTRVPYLLY